MTNIDELAEAIKVVTNAFAAGAIRWAVGGSLASTAYGEPRATNDVDIVAVLSATAATKFIAELGPDFYADADMAQEAVRRRSSFNIVDNRSVLKIDIFVPGPGALGEGQLTRARELKIFPNAPAIPFLSAEDIVLQKLRWYKLGNEVSDRQWRDVLSVLRTVGSAMDLSYVRAVASDNDLATLLARAIEESA
jgi:hypothetical protein